MYMYKIYAYKYTCIYIKYTHRCTHIYTHTEGKGRHAEQGIAYN